MQGKALGGGPGGKAPPGSSWIWPDLHTSEPVCVSVFCSAYSSLSVFYGQVVCVGDGYRKHVLRIRHIIRYLENIFKLKCWSVDIIRSLLKLVKIILLGWTVEMNEALVFKFLACHNSTYLIFWQNIYPSSHKEGSDIFFMDWEGNGSFETENIPFWFDFCYEILKNDPLRYRNSSKMLQMVHSQNFLPHPCFLCVRFSLVG